MKKLLSFVLLFASINAQAEDFYNIVKKDNMLGKITAPVTFIEYGSMTCGHCSRFHADVFEKLKKEYINTGKVAYAFRPMPLDDLAFAVSKIVVCSGKDSYYNFLDAYYATQKQWIYAEDKLKSITSIAQLGGLSKQKAEMCIKNKQIHEKVAYFKNSAISLGVDSTPSFLINGKLYKGRRDYMDLKTLIEKELTND